MDGTVELLSDLGYDGMDDDFGADVYAAPASLPAPANEEPAKEEPTPDAIPVTSSNGGGAADGGKKDGVAFTVTLAPPPASLATPAKDRRIKYFIIKSRNHQVLTPSSEPPAPHPVQRLTLVHFSAQLEPCLS